YRRKARKADVPGGVFWGLLTGLTSFVSHSGAPPFQMYVLPQHLPKLVFAGTSTILFAIVNAVKLVPYWQLQQFSNLETSLGLWLFPAVLVGSFVGANLTRIMPDGPFFLLVQLTLFGLSLKLIADWIVPYFFGCINSALLATPRPFGHQAYIGHVGREGAGMADADVFIIGAGLSGRVAAHILAAS